MDHRDKWRLTLNRDVLLDDIPTNIICQRLRSGPHCIFTRYDTERIEYKQTKLDKNALLLDMLVTKGPQAYEAFVSALKEAEIDHLVECLENTDFFPLTKPPSRSTGSTTLFHDVNKKVMLAHLHQSLAEALPSVILLARSDGHGVGSGFRVGPTYVMTNCHVVKELSAPLGSNAVLFHFNKSLMQSLSQGIIHAAPILSVVTSNEDLDMAVVELDFTSALSVNFSHCKRITEQTLPLPLARFKAIVRQEYVHFVGHPHGQEKVLDTQCKIEHLTDADNEKLLELHRRSNMDMFKTIADTRGALYQSSLTFGPGSSGSPGFVADDQQEACLAVMHTCGHNIVLPPGEFRLTTVEQGVRVEYIYDFINKRDPVLCQLIFPGGRPA